MGRLLIFNPENDLALASNRKNYTPPSAALDLRRAGSLLPFLWAREGDIVYSPEANPERLEALRSRFGLKGTLLDDHSLSHVTEVCPWGWSQYIVDCLLLAGVNADLLPTRAQMDEHRRLSHRRLTIELHRQLGTDEWIHPREAFTIEEAKEIMDTNGESVVKLPWSGSGRGVLYTRTTGRDNILRQISGIIKHQGSVIIEPELNKASDFAALFSSDGKQVRFIGLSIFVTDVHGVYAGNYVLPQQIMIETIGRDLSGITSQLESSLTEIVAPHYKGCLGVDMMLYRPEGARTLKVNPCVEVNLRMTMGFVALSLLPYVEAEKKMGVLHIGRCSVPNGCIDLTGVKGAMSSIWLEMYDIPF